jgi:D-aminoacyl-tRNA deacylase
MLGFSVAGVVRILYSSKDPVGATLKRMGYDFEDVGEEVVEFSYNSPEPAVMISRHYSASGIPTFTVHHVGNPTGQALGGRPFCLGTAHPRLARSILLQLRGMEIPVTYEATHHGPTPEAPLVFAELGSREEMWGNERLVRTLADAVVRGIDSYKDLNCEIAVGMGGGHYAPTFTNMDTHCFGHIISKHHLRETTDDVLRQAMVKSIEPVKEVILNDVSSSLRSRISSLALQFGLQIKFGEHSGQ